MKIIKLFEEFINEAEKFTFKTEKPTGRWAWTSKPSHYIKLKGKKVGSIDHEAPHKVRFMVMKNGTTITDNNKNCPWKWICLKKDSESVDAAKIWVNTVIDSLKNQYELHSTDI